MSVLDRIQHDFCQSVLGHGNQNFLSHIKESSQSKERRLGIYHNNIFMVHTHTLESHYPLLFAIITHYHGSSETRRMSQEFSEISLPCMGSLEEWGGGLITFLQRYDPLAHMPYLAEVAQYEWAKHRAYCSIEKPLLTEEEMVQLGKIGEENPTFKFQNSCQLLAFNHDIKPFVDVFSQGGIYQPSEAAPQSNSYSLIVKHKGIIKVYWLTPSMFVFLNRLKEGQDVDVAFAAAEVLEPEFDAQESFVFLLTNPVLQSLYQNEI